VPIGNAGNITAVMRGFLKLHSLGVIDSLPRLFGVQSEHADPVYRYYAAPKSSRRFEPVRVTPSVAQAAMIGNPVSFPRVRALAEAYTAIAGDDAFQVMQVTEQSIMDCMLLANRNGHIACTQGGECLAGLLAARDHGLVDASHFSILDATAHALKFMDFQNMYFTGTFAPEFGVTPDPKLVNRPDLLLSPEERKGLSEDEFVTRTAAAMVERLGLAEKQ